jgi:hypothetical protein
MKRAVDIGTTGTHPELVRERERAVPELQTGKTSCEIVINCGAKYLWSQDFKLNIGLVFEYASSEGVYHIQTSHESMCTTST